MYITQFLTECKTFSKIKAALILRSSNSDLLIANQPCADQVVVLSGGIVAEQGSPAELYARKGLYAHMVDLQSASQNWTI